MLSETDMIWEVVEQSREMLPAALVVIAGGVPTRARARAVYTEKRSAPNAVLDVAVTSVKGGCVFDADPFARRRSSPQLKMRSSFAISEAVASLSSTRVSTSRKGVCSQFLSASRTRRIRFGQRHQEGSVWRIFHREEVCVQVKSGFMWRSFGSFGLLAVFKELMMPLRSR